MRERRWLPCGHFAVRLTARRSGYREGVGGRLRRSATIAIAAALLASAPAEAGDSVTYQANPQHTGAIDDAVAPPLAIRWARDMGEESSYPIVAGGKVFVTTKTTGSGYGTTLYALDAQTGAVAW